MAIGLTYSMTAKDISSLSKKFWDCHSDPILTFDGAAATLLTIQYNLVAGTLAQYLTSRQDLAPLIDDLLQYRIIGQFCLTELGHGLDAPNLETTATLLPSANSLFIAPLPGRQRVTARLLPPRGGTNPVNHSITSFKHVRIPYSALLGSTDKPGHPRAAFLECIQRVSVGSIALACTGLVGMEAVAYIGMKYSLRRMVGPPSHQSPILKFRTQQIPTLTALAQYFSNFDIDFRMRHAVAACMKAVVIQCAQVATLSLSERCGAQGLFAINQMSVIHAELRGIAIAEGDILAISIRLAAELLLGRYALPQAADPDSLLARHETELFEERRAILANTHSSEGRMDENHLLPHCQAMVEAAGHRMAYDAARAAGIMPGLIDLYVSSIIKQDSAWYVEKMGLSRSAQARMEAEALDAVLPHVNSLVNGLNVAPYITAPIISDANWDGFLDSLECFESPLPSTAAFVQFKYHRR
ncbi:acyl-CoA dehydrogenase NM domain-like protein [Infundibulicybe gibba]|nr:acyl-CoA dehydrogenase NM domain-like protein [Infundibulicybe gibba]